MDTVDVKKVLRVKCDANLFAYIANRTGSLFTNNNILAVNAGFIQSEVEEGGKHLKFILELTDSKNLDTILFELD